METRGPRPATGALRKALALYCALLAVGLAPLLLRRSSHAAVLSRYSIPYAILLALYIALIGTTVMLAIRAAGGGLRRDIPRCTGRCRIGIAGASVIALFLLLQVRSPRVWSLLPHLALAAAIALTGALAAAGPRSRAALVRLQRFFSSRCLARCVAVFLSSLILISLIEFALRLRQPFLFGHTIFVKDPEIGFRLRPGLPGTNSEGFRDIERTAARPPGGYRIVALGDSFAFGLVPYEHNFLAILERRLGDRLRRDVEVINMGIPAYGPKEELVLLEKRGLRYGPDHVLVNFFAGNDFTDSYFARDTYRDRILLNGVHFNVRRLPHGALMLRHWYLCHYIKVGWVTLSRRGEGVEGGGDGTGAGGGGGERDGPAANRRPPAPDDGGVDPETFLSESEFDEILRITSELFMRANESRQSDMFEQASSFLLGMKALAEEGGAGFSVVLIPDQICVDPAVQRKVFRLTGLQDSDFDFEWPSRRFREFSARHGVPVIDLHPLFREMCRRERLYIRRDTHWNEAGNRLAGEAIAGLWEPSL
ncbi:MAG: hypothetical protein PHN82_00910 [bacterium]|nr:hypothetical protein [bacterium]